MSDQVSITCGRRDERNRRRVVAKFGEQSHVDRFDVDQQFSRSNWRDAVISKLGLEDDAHEFLDGEVQRVAAAQDESGGDIWQPTIVSLEEIQPLETDWLWEHYLPAGAISVLEGDPGLGKTQALLDMAARLSRGDSMPPHSAPNDTYSRRGSLILNAEDDPARTLRPRLEAAGADISRITLFREMAGFDGEETRPVSLPGDLPYIKSMIEANDIGLVIIDPWVAYLDSSLSMNSDADVRRCLGQVATTAEETGAAFVLLRHLNKKSGLNAMYRGGGSIGITGAARAVFIVGQDPTDADGRILAPVKCNLAPEPPSLRFHIESVETTSRVCWGDACEVSAAEILQTDRPGGGGKFAQAEDIISDALAHGPRGSNEVMQECEEAGISESTYHRARKSLGVKSKKIDFGGQWMLSLPTTMNGESF